MFDRHYEVILADNAAGRSVHYHIRYLVYCMETGFEDETQFPDGMERDSWDNNAVHFIVRARATGEWIAAMRLILPRQGQLPVEHLCQLDASALPAATPSQLGEISRLCIVDHARRRLHDHAALQGIADLTPSPNTFREPEIMLGLLRAAAAYSRSHGICYWYYMTTTALARMINRLNIMLKPVGPGVQHRGERYPYLADLAESEQRISDKSTDLAAMLAQRNTYRLFSAVFGDDIGTAPSLVNGSFTPTRAGSYGQRASGQEIKASAHLPSVPHGQRAP